METEVTVQVLDSLENVKDYLNQMGAVLEREFYMTDWYFSKYDSDTLYALTYEDIIAHSFLLREIDGEHPVTSIMYKKKILNEKGEVVEEEKISTNINSIEVGINIFKNAGINNWCKMETASYVYKLNDMELVIQDVANVGLFIEYEEDENTKGLTAEEKFIDLVSKVKSLGLNIGEDFSVKKVYMKFLQERNN